MAAGIVTILKALAAIPALVATIQEIAAAISVWYISSAQAADQAAFMDAAAFASRAKTDEDRQEALNKWRLALNRPRTLP